jgi:SAM-dependent methyltransferase
MIDSSALRFGRDVSSGRRDELDLECIAYGVELVRQRRSGIAVLDIGAGYGAVAQALSDLPGTNVTAVDRDPALQPHYDRVRHSRPNLEFRQCDVAAEWPFEDATFAIVACQRMLHYLPHAAALVLLGRIRRALDGDGRLFISASGAGSELADGLDLAPLAQRFGVLRPDRQAQHDIREPVCLYGRDEFAATLETAGFGVDRCWLSEFGNVKAIARAMAAAAPAPGLGGGKTVIGGLA